jgi:hypothetical protein
MNLLNELRETKETHWTLLQESRCKLIIWPGSKKKEGEKCRTMYLSNYIEEIAAYLGN